MPPKQITITLQPETLAAHDLIHSWDDHSHDAWLGAQVGEPLLIAMDALIRYAKAYPLAKDRISRGHWLNAAKAIEALFVTASDPEEYSTGALESVFWFAVKAAGFFEDSENADCVRPEKPKARNF